MKLATWNVNSLAARMPRVLEWLQQVQPDVLCLQETKLAEAAFPREDFAALGYETASYGMNQWNGTAIVSRTGLDDIRRGFDEEPGFPDPEARALAATCGGIRVWSVYVPNGRSVESPHYTYKLAWLTAFRAQVRADLARRGMLAVLGDFNIAPTDADVWDPAEFVSSTHVTAAEREGLRGLLDLGLTDVQPRALKGAPFTYWDYRAGNFHKGLGMRIDLALLSQPLNARLQDAYIDRDTRKGKLPSDHAAVVVQLRD